MTTSPAALQSIPETQASGEVAALYADYRAVLGVPVVNLIWRHIATLPGALAWSWGLLRPLYASGAVEAVAQQLVTGLALPPGLGAGTCSLPMLAAAGVPAAELPTVRRILDTYHRANPLNLMALSVLRARLEGAAPAGGGDASAAAPGATPPAVAPSPAPLPTLLALDALPPDLVALAWELAALGVRDAAPEMPTVWRQLAHWPGYLAVALALLRPLDAQGWLSREMDGLRARRAALAGSLAAALPTTARLPAAALGTAAPGAASVAVPLPAAPTQVALRAALTRFTDGLIVRMVPQLAVLRAALPTPGTGAP